MENQVQDNDTVEINVGQVFLTLWKHVVLILAVTVICADLGFVYAVFIATPRYSASASMLVNNKSEANQNTQDITSQDITASSTLIETYSAILKSHSVLESIIKDLNLDYTYDELADEISVESYNNTQVMQITVTDTDRDRALAITREIVKIAPDQIIDKAEVGSVKTVDDPWSREEPVYPSIPRFTVIAGLVGFVLICIYLIVKELMNNRFQNEQDVTRILDLPVLAVIPLEHDETD